jgi:large subunit ribosomal protein L29
MRAKDLRERTVEDLKELEKSLTRDTFQNRFKNFTNRLDDTSAMKKTRRDLARVKTLLRQLALGNTVLQTSQATSGAVVAASAAVAEKVAKAAPAATGSPAPQATPRAKAEKKAPKAKVEAAVPAPKSPASRPSQATAGAAPKSKPAVAKKSSTKTKAAPKT